MWGCLFPVASSEGFTGPVPSYELTVAEEAVGHFTLPELAHVIFYAMILNEAMRLGVLHRRTLREMESALTKLRWSTFESWVGMAGPKGEGEKGKEGKRETGPRERKGKEDVGCGWVEQRLGQAHDKEKKRKRQEIEQAAEYIRNNFQWALREPSAPGPRSLPPDYHELYPRFDLGVATRHAHDSNISEMVQIIFYVMVIDDAAELRLSHKLSMDCVMWAKRKLDWGPVKAWLGDNDRRPQRT
ncbi:hypothetical protein Cgig2_010032 [Carnegiea gigantea]|uniref:Uncharacterized protein n=1 Tax=Carnegiea gigantea TaxID=171969 RepID=A0A9Q1GNT7_9CARY|nr:hypothetical protein Cgig2_010032 [Carnegiea gigantea]